MKKLLLLGLLGLRLAAQPVITSQPVNQFAVWGGSATFSVMATGAGPLTYQWQLNGTNLPNNIISTMAGGNLFNNLPATNTILNNPSGTATDTNGNLFIADYGNHVIRKVDTNGIATIVAGNGSGSFSGDGGAATNAGLFFPINVILDSAGNLLIADSSNNRIRKVDTNGVISTVAGNGTTPFPSQVGDNGAATNAGINTPEGICLDTNGNLFIADTLDQRIRKVTTNGIITTIAGNGTAGYITDGGPATSTKLNNPTSVTMDLSNNLYIADSANNRIRKVNAGGFISTVAGTGTAGYSGDSGAGNSAKINNPLGVALDAAARNIFIVDQGNNRVRKMTNNIITTVAGSGTNGYSGDGGPATSANLSVVQNVSVDKAGNLFIADAGNNLIRKTGTDGNISTVAGRVLNDGDFATNATLNFVYGTAFDLAGNLYIADANNNRIRKVDVNGIISTVAGNGIAAYSGDGDAATNASLNHPYSVTLDALGNLFIADRSNVRIRKVDTNGNISTVAGTGSAGFSGDGGAATNAKISSAVSCVAVDLSGNSFFADSSNMRVRKVDTNGFISTVAGNGSFGYSGDGGPATNAALLGPSSVAFDSVGNFYIADAGNRRIRKVNSNGIISTVAGNGSNGYSGDGSAATNASFQSLTGVTADSSGNIFISDSFSMVVRKVGTNGIINTVAGNGIQGFAGDGGAGNNAKLSTPRGLAADSLGDVFISDAGNNRVRRLSYVGYADQPSFTLTNVTPANWSNHFAVIITSASGSVTSSVVAVNLQLPPVMPSFTVSNGVYTLTWNAVSNLSYQLQSTTNLVAPVWIDLGSPVTATNNSVSTTDASSSDGQRFYRVRLWP